MDSSLEKILERIKTIFSPEDKKILLDNEEEALLLFFLTNEAREKVLREVKIILDLNRMLKSFKSNFIKESKIVRIAETKKKKKYDSSFFAGVKRHIDSITRTQANLIYDKTFILFTKLYGEKAKKIARIKISLLINKHYKTNYYPKLVLKTFWSHFNKEERRIVFASTSGKPKVQDFADLVEVRNFFKDSSYPNDYENYLNNHPNIILYLMGYLTRYEWNSWPGLIDDNKEALQKASQLLFRGSKKRRSLVYSTKSRSAYLAGFSEYYCAISIEAKKLQLDIPIYLKELGADFFKDHLTEEFDQGEIYFSLFVKAAKEISKMKFSSDYTLGLRSKVMGSKRVRLYSILDFIWVLHNLFRENPEFLKNVVAKISAEKISKLTDYYHENTRLFKHDKDSANYKWGEPERFKLEDKANGAIFEITEITDTITLENESAKMKHCIESYRNRFVEGTYRAFHLVYIPINPIPFVDRPRSIELTAGFRLRDITVARRRDMEAITGHNYNPKWNIDQCLGKLNKHPLDLGVDTDALENCYSVLRDKVSKKYNYPVERAEKMGNAKVEGFSSKEEWFVNLLKRL